MWKFVNVVIYCILFFDIAIYAQSNQNLEEELKNAIICMNEGDNELADSLFTFIIKADSNNFYPLAYYYRALCKLEIKNIPSACEDLIFVYNTGITKVAAIIMTKCRKYVEVDSDLLVNYYEELGKKAIFDDNYLDAIKYYDSALVISENDFDLLNGRIHAFMNLRRFHDAIRDIDKLIVMVQNNDNILSDLFFDRGFANLQLKQFNSAINDFSNSLQLDPSNVIVQYNLAKTHFLENNFSATLKIVNNVISNYGSNPKFTLLLAISKIETGDIQDGCNLLMSLDKEQYLQDDLYRKYFNSCE